MENLEFGSTKAVRKTLIVISFLGIFLEYLEGYSTGKIEFFGFTIPLEDTGVLPKFASFLILFYIVALCIRYSDEKFKEEYRRFLNMDPSDTRGIVVPVTPNRRYSLKKKQITKWMKRNNFALVFLDLIFPLILGLFALFFIYS